MPARRLLFVDATRLSAHRWQLGALHDEGEFTADEAGLAALAEYLGQHRGSIFYLIADVAEEGFQIEDIPYVQGRDRIAIIKRKLGQYFYGTPLAVALSLGRNKDGRRDEKMLFTALTRPQQFEPWLEVLRLAHTQLVGVFSMPMVLAAMAAVPAGRPEPSLLISITRGGLRQTFFDHGQLRFSRLTPLATGGIDEAAVTSTIEAAKIYQYLAGQRLIARGTPLATRILAHPSQQQAFRARCQDTAELRFEFVDLLAEAARHGLKTPPTDSHGERLFMHLLVRHTPRHQLAPSAERHFYRLWQLRFALLSAGVVSLMAGLMVAAKHTINYFEIADRANLMRTEAESSRRRYDAILQTLPKTPLSTDNLRALMNQYEHLEKRSPGPEPTYAVISRALERSPRVELSRLAWSLAGRPDNVPTAKAPAATATGGQIVTELHGHLPLGMAGDHRAQIAAIEAFADGLRAADPGAEVRVLTMPFDLESGKSLKSGTDDTRVETPKFTLRMVRKP